MTARQIRLLKQTFTTLALVALFVGTALYIGSPLWMR